MAESARSSPGPSDRTLSCGQDEGEHAAPDGIGGNEPVWAPIKLRWLLSLKRSAESEAEEAALDAKAAESKRKEEEELQRKREAWENGGREEALKRDEAFWANLRENINKPRARCRANLHAIQLRRGLHRPPQPLQPNLSTPQTATGMAAIVTPSDPSTMLGFSGECSEQPPTPRPMPSQTAETPTPLPGDDAPTPLPEDDAPTPLPGDEAPTAAKSPEVQLVKVVQPPTRMTLLSVHPGVPAKGPSAEKIPSASAQRRALRWLDEEERKDGELDELAADNPTIRYVLDLRERGIAVPQPSLVQTRLTFEPSKKRQASSPPAQDTTQATKRSKRGTPSPQYHVIFGRFRIPITPNAVTLSNFEPPRWPNDVVHLADHFNPFGIGFPFVQHFGKCGCKTSCRKSKHCDGEDVKTEYAVVATRALAKDVAIGQYLGRLGFEPVDARHRSKNEGYRLHLHRESDLWGRNTVCMNALKFGSLLRFCNHSCSPNAYFHEVSSGRRRTVVVVTRRVIQRGEEITVDYGNNLWFRCRCPNCAGDSEKETEEESDDDDASDEEEQGLGDVKEGGRGGDVNGDEEKDEEGKDAEEEDEEEEDEEEEDDEELDGEDLEEGDFGDDDKESTSEEELSDDDNSSAFSDHGNIGSEVGSEEDTSVTQDSQ